MANMYGIAEIGTFNSVSIRNGSIKIIGTQNGSRMHGIYLASSHHSLLADLEIIAHSTPGPGALSIGVSLAVSSASVINHVVTDSHDSVIMCPSVVVDSAIRFSPTPSCAVSNVVSPVTIIP